jgi:hypothetical protein
MRILIEFYSIRIDYNTPPRKSIVLFYDITLYDTRLPIMNSGLDYTELDKAQLILLNNNRLSSSHSAVSPLHADFRITSDNSRTPVREGYTAYTESTITPLAANTIDISNQFHDISTNMIKYNTLYNTMNTDKQYDFSANAYTRLSPDYIPGTRETALGDIQEITEHQNRIYVYTSLGLISLVVAGILLNSSSST